MTQIDIEQLILVDEQDVAIGSGQKLDCHLGKGKLHRAFSILIFNQHNQLLLQQRSEQKLLWPGFWSNSCCSHPGVGESVEAACARRLAQELGMACELEFVYKFQYYAQYLDVGAESELCHVLIGKTVNLPQPNPAEIAQVKWLSATELEQQLLDCSERYTPWFKQEWSTLKSHHWTQIARLLRN
jgi:isopentenyl-diphosphate delta-isomerase